MEKHHSCFSKSPYSQGGSLYFQFLRCKENHLRSKQAGWLQCISIDHDGWLFLTCLPHGIHPWLIPTKLVTNICPSSSLFCLMISNSCDRLGYSFYFQAPKPLPSLCPLTGSCLSRIHLALTPTPSAPSVLPASASCLFALPANVFLCFFLSFLHGNHSGCHALLELIHMASVLFLHTYIFFFQSNLLPWRTQANGNFSHTFSRET